jgi:hypothetical protein
VGRPLAAVDTADRPEAVVVDTAGLLAAAADMADLLVAAGLLAAGLPPAAAVTADRRVAVDMADRLAADLRPVVTVDLRKADRPATVDRPVTADLRARRPACISLRATAARWVPAATCLR